MLSFLRLAACKPRPGIRETCVKAVTSASLPGPEGISLSHQQPHRWVY